MANRSSSGPRVGKPLARFNVTMSDVSAPGRHAPAAEADLFLPGEKFRGYIVQKLIGRGGAGEVYQVRHEFLSTLYALKVLHPDDMETDDTVVKRFLREARLATRVRHPGLVAVHDCGFDEVKSAYYIVMDYVEGSTLRNLLAFEGRLDLSRAAGIVAQVASALKAAQAFNVVHRDIKPENIMIQPDGRVKLLDLGIAKADNLGDSLRTNTGSQFGTPAYISPEQAVCSTDVDTRADVYSLGIVFFEMLTGRSPYSGGNAVETLKQILSDDPTPDVRDFAPEVPPAVAVLVRRMTVKERERRIVSFDELLGTLSGMGFAEVVRPLGEAEIVQASAPGVKTLLDGLDATPSSRSEDALSDADTDVVQFMNARKQRRYKRLGFRILVASVALAAAILLLLLLL